MSGIIDLMASWDSLCSLKCLPPAGIVTGSLFPWILWSIWKARNRFLFEGFSSSPEDTLSSAIALAREWSLEVKKESSVGRSSRMPRASPPPGTIVIRSDAAWSATTKEAGLGWAIFDGTGNRPFQMPSKAATSPLAA